jgi:hypothetical protein
LNASLCDVEGSAAAGDFAGEEAQEFWEDLSCFRTITLKILLPDGELTLQVRVAQIPDKVINIEEFWDLISYRGVTRFPFLQLVHSQLSFESSSIKTLRPFLNHNLSFRAIPFL